MTGKGFLLGWLQMLPSHGNGQLSRRYSLSSTQAVVIGRHPECDIVLDSSQDGISRRHASIRFLHTADNSDWIICDLDSSNGTFVNGLRLRGCQKLHSGDRITLGDNDAKFVFECQPVPLPLPNQPQKRESSTRIRTKLHPTPLQASGAVSFSQLFPILSTGRDLVHKAYLIPGILTVIFVVLMFATVGQPSAAINQMLVATYLAGAAYYFIYQLCGKYKPWWVVIGCAGLTVLILLSPILPIFIFIFRHILPGELPHAAKVNFLELLMRMFIGAGLMEELLKAIPVLGAYFLGRRLHSPWRERIGVWEPLDGILLGTASAVGFTLLETLGQYVPQIAQASLSGQNISQVIGLQLLIPRVLGSIAGHMADSGYFGYFIGLSVLKPRQRWQILAVGYFSAAALHALWNSTGLFSGLLLAVVGILSYAFLTAAILKARMLSLSRKQEATRVLKTTHKKQ